MGSRQVVILWYNIQKQYGVVVTESKKILLCAVHSKYIHSSPAVYYLKKAMEIFAPESGFETNIFEGSINDTDEHLLYNILSETIDIIGFSVYIWNVEKITRLCRSIKAVCPHIKIILGGPEVSYGLEHTGFKDTDFDFIVSGEGEKAFVAAAHLAAGKEVPSVVQYFLNGKIITSPLIENLDEIPFVYDEKNIKNFENRIVYYESSRGCPFSCAYCLSSVCGKVRFLSLERVFSDIDFFIRHDIPQVKFVDRTFNCSKERAVKIWEYILKRSGESKTNFHFEIGADLLDEKGLAALEKMPAGKVQLEIGIQSTNESALRESCRYAPNDKIFGNVKALVNFRNINIHTDLIAGLPYEDIESFKRSFDEVYGLKSHQLQLGFLKLLSGAPLNGIKEKHGYCFSEFPPYEVLKNNYISFRELQELKEIEDAVEKFYNSGRFVLSLEKIEKRFCSPFEMYQKIAEKLKLKNMLFASVSTKNLYDFLDEFSPGISKELLEDFYLSENSQIVPQSLKHLVPLNKFMQPAANKFLKENGFSHSKKVLAKFINNEALAIDYSRKNPVTGRYEVLLRKEVDLNE